MHMELINTGENAMNANKENRIVGLNLVATHRKTGKREDLAGSTGLQWLGFEEVERQYNWLVETAKSEDFQKVFKDFEIEKVYTKIETVRVA